MNSKRKRNTILAYCMATVIMLCVLASNVFEATTSLKTTKKVVAGNNYVETSEISYGLVAIEASSSIDEKNAQNVTEEKEEKKEESQKEPVKASENKKVSSTSNATKTKTATSNTKKTTSNKAATSKKTTVKKSNTTTKKSNTAAKKSNTTTVKKSNTTTSNKSTTTTTNNSGLGTQIVNYAKQFNGNPYVHGGTSLTKGADCSGFVQSVYKHFGINLPRTSKAQSQVGKKVSWDNLQPGDLIFYGNHSTTVSHVAIYIGNGKIIHAQTPRLGIGITTYKIMTRVVARRVI